MSDFSSMLDDYFEGIENLKAGIIIEPEIIEINNNNIIVDLNYKSEGIISLKEILETDSEINYKLGDSIKLYVESTDDGLGYPILSYNKASKIINFEEIQKSNSENHFIEVFVEKETPRGLVANFKGIECFIPNILCGIKKDDSLTSLVGKKIFVKVIKIKNKTNIIASHKYYLEFKSGINKKQIIDDLNVGDKIKVKVKNITSYGAFVTYNSIDSLLYIKDFSWFNTVDAKKVFSRDEEIEVIVYDINKEEEKIFISKKDLDTSPWDEVVQKYKEGDELKLKVSDFNRHGLYLRHNDKIDFFLHKKNMIDMNGEPEEHFSVGDEVIVRIKEIVLEQRTLKITM